ncbi:Shikimate dehydrogenase (NADP(+)) [Buchnera aphidicola (Eriosoma grossulariae)]|uniref:shikimate dehydrogenase n=1 Tax=Buchnera aphidicola TaxID=9 RepID=UPI00346391D0
MDNYLSKFIVIGNPIKHSQSPFIHKKFSEQTGIQHQYCSKKVFKNNFIDFLTGFFNNGGEGVNITAPFKKQAFFFSDVLTYRAKLAHSVNTLKKFKNGIILGDNTDGEGLLYDLCHLNFIQKNNNILLLGAGGAAYGVIGSLLDFNCSIFIFNRTYNNAKILVSHFSKYGNIKAVMLNDLYHLSFDLIINATSSGITGDKLVIPDEVLNNSKYFYDMYYQSGLTPFLILCQKNGAKYIKNGIGMLVNQAAASFFLWHGIRPKVDPVINSLKKLLKCT